MAQEQKEGFRNWCVLELLGHRRLGGLVTEALIAGSPFIRIDIHIEKQATTQFYSPSSVYSIIPVGEAEARAVAKYNQAEPVHRYEMEKLQAPKERWCIYQDSAYCKETIPCSECEVYRRRPESKTQGSYAGEEDKEDDT